MLRIVNTNKGKPITYPVRLGGSYFEPGCLAKNYNIITCMSDLSDDESCIGIIDDLRSSTEDTTISSGLITIWNVLGLRFITDMHQCNFLAHYGNNLSVPLYCNKGKLSTSKLTVNQNPIATLVGFFSSQGTSWIEAVWL